MGLAPLIHEVVSGLRFPLRSRTGRFKRHLGMVEGRLALPGCGSPGFPGVVGG